MQSAPLGSNGMMENHAGRQSSQSRIIGDLKGGEEELFLKMGDCFSLLSVEGDGYLYSEGFIDRGCKLQTIRKRRTVPPNFTECIFRIVPRYKYDAQNALSEALDRLSRSRSSIGFTSVTSGTANSAIGGFITGGNQNHAGLGVAEQTASVEDEELLLRELQEAERVEQNENVSEYLRMASKPITYGQIVQLRQVTSGKFVTVTVKEVADLEKHCLRVVLDDDGNEGSAFIITPRYKIRSEGENVHMGDQILLTSKKYSMFLHVSHLFFNSGQREVNASPIPTAWRVIPYAPYRPDENKYLKSGDIIGLFHKEIEGYLTKEMIEDEQIILPRKNGIEDRGRMHSGDQVFFETLRGEDKGRQKNSNSLWMIEKRDAGRGGVCSYDNLYRFKHLATGYYLAAYVETSVRGDRIRNRRKEDTKIDIDRILEHTLDGFPEPELCCKLTAIDDYMSSATLFSIHPFNRSTAIDDNHIALDSYICLRHYNTQCWLHALREEATVGNSNFNSSMMSVASSFGPGSPLSSSQDEHEKDNTTMPTIVSNQPIRTKIVGTPKLNDEDVLAMVIVDHEETDNVLMVVGQLSFLKEYLEQVKQGDRITNAKKVIGILTDMIISCSRSGDSNPLTREGIPIISQQDLLREQNIMSVIMDLLRETFVNESSDSEDDEYDDPYEFDDVSFAKIRSSLGEDDVITDETKLNNSKDHVEMGIKLEDLHSPANFTTFTICRLCYHLLKQILKSNSTNRERMSKYIAFIQKHIGYLPEATDTLMELFRDNRKLLHFITDDQIYFFIRFLQEKGRVPSFINFLAVLCSCNGVSLPKNQNFILKHLVEERSHLLVPMKIDSGKVMIEKDNEEGVWLPLEDYMKQCDDTQRTYFSTLIELYSALCLGSNTITIQAISKFVHYDLLLAAIRNPALPAHLRASFCDLLLNLCVKSKPQKPVNFVNYTRLWVDLRAGGPAVVRENSEYDFVELKQFIFSYIRNNPVQTISNWSKNKLILSVVILCKNLFSLGYFTTEEIHKIIPDLIALLDGRTDIISERRNNKKRVYSDTLSRNLAPDFSLKSRYEKSDYSILVMETKLNLTQILNMVCDFRLDLRLTELLLIFKQKMDAGKGSAASRANSNTSLSVSKSSSGSSQKLDTDSKSGPSTSEANPTQPVSVNFVEKRIDELFQILNLDHGTSIFVPILLDLVLYEHQDLASQAANLLVRHYSQRAELVKALQQVQILVSYKNVTTYQTVQYKCDELRKLTSPHLTHDQLDAMKSILKDFTSLCASDQAPPVIQNTGPITSQKINEEGTNLNNRNMNNPEHQRILHNLRAHHAVIDLLHLPFNIRGTTRRRNSDTPQQDPVVISSETPRERNRSRSDSNSSSSSIEEDENEFDQEDLDETGVQELFVLGFNFLRDFLCKYA